MNSLTVQCSICPAQCAICLDEVFDWSLIRILPKNPSYKDFKFPIQESYIAVQLNCRHIYHIECINEWLNVKPNCPYCLKDIFEASVLEDKKWKFIASTTTLILFLIVNSCFNTGDNCRY